MDESATETSQIAISATLQSMLNLKSSTYLHSSRINAMWIRRRTRLSQSLSSQRDLTVLRQCECGRIGRRRGRG